MVYELRLFDKQNISKISVLYKRMKNEIITGIKEGDAPAAPFLCQFPCKGKKICLEGINFPLLYLVFSCQLIIKLSGNNICKIDWLILWRSHYAAEKQK